MIDDTTATAPAPAPAVVGTNGRHPPPEPSEAFAQELRKVQKDKPPVPTDDELAETWHAKYPGTVFGLGEFRRYAGGWYRLVDGDQANAELTEVVIAAKGQGAKPTSRLLASVKALAGYMHTVARDRWDTNADILACANGTLHIPTRALREHRPTDYLTSGVSYDYDEHAQAPAFAQALRTTVPDAAEFLQEFAGYALTTDCRFELAVWFYGERGSGKSTLLEGLRAMLGERCGLLGLADVERSSFSLSNLPGKTLVISTEQPAHYMSASHVLNAIISGERVIVDRKFRDPIEITSTAKLAWAMNELPRIPDAGDGLFRRVKVVRFPKLACAPDPELKERVKREGAGILNWALAGLARLRERGRFDIPACVRDATERFQTQNDVPATFVAECCLTGPEYEVRAAALYQAYKDWCLTNGHKPQSSTSLADEWERLGFERRRKMEGTVYAGIGLLTVDQGGAQGQKR